MGNNYKQSKQATLTVKQKLWLRFFVILLITAVFAGIVAPQVPNYIPGSSWFNKFHPKLGLDLQGGAHLVFEADTSNLPPGEEESAIEGVRDVIERRVNAFGVSEPLVQTNKVGDKYRVIVELAGVFDVNDAIKQIGETPLLEFKEQNPEYTAEPKLTPEQQQELEQYNKEAYQKAKDIIAKLNQGEDFAELAKKYSEDPGSKDKGGDLGFVKRGLFVPEFDKAIFDDLKVGEITSEPVETVFGYHIIQKLEERGEGENKEVHARHILIAKKKPTDIVQPAPQWINTKLSGKHLKRATLVFDQNTGAPQVSLQFNDEGKKLFAEITKRNLYKPVAIFLDGEPISIPTVQAVITDGEAVITGDFTIQEAKQLAQKLNAGALPVPIKLVSQQTVGPTLGKESLDKSLKAGMIGLLALVVFMILYYRLPGLLAVFALLIYSVAVFGLYELIGVTMTLAGIAGYILSLGIAVDANVLIFERLKEELSKDQPFNKAVEESFKRAWEAIRDSNISTLITTAILFWFGTSVIKGFALTLSIGVIVSMFTAIFVTKVLLLLFSGSRLTKHQWLFGYHKDHSADRRDNNSK